MTTAAPSPIRSTPGHFAPTQWTMVWAAAHPENAPAGQAALEALCRCYWQPLYAYIRRQGAAAHDAEDLTQAFFAHLLARNSLAQAERGKGKFRSFLLACLKHFLAHERERAQALKRGAGVRLVPFDLLDAESRLCAEPIDTLSPEKAFERQWALAVLEQVLAQLRAEFVQAGKEALFENLKPFLTGEGEPQAAAAARCGLSAGALKVAVHRLRRRYRELLRAAIAQTVASPQEVEEELRHLFAAFQ